MHPDLQQCAIQLILASFDVVANAVFRNEGSKNGHLLKSFLVNKVPLILGSLAASSTLYSFDARLCIETALKQVDTNIFPTLSGMFDMSNTTTSFHDTIRQDFFYSCQLHEMVTDAEQERLLGEITYQSLPEEGRLTKEMLVQQCIHDPERTQRLIAALDKMDGNVGASAQALMEVCFLLLYLYPFSFSFSSPFLLFINTVLSLRFLALEEVIDTACLQTDWPTNDFLVARRSLTSAGTKQP
jgi:mediator of RNA polymerase II transcription subunit 5